MIRIKWKRASTLISALPSLPLQETVLKCFGIIGYIEEWWYVSVILLCYIIQSTIQCSKILVLDYRFRISSQPQNKISVLKQENSITSLSWAVCLSLHTTWGLCSFNRTKQLFSAIESCLHWKVTSSDLQIWQRQKAWKLSLSSCHAEVLT